MKNAALLLLVLMTFPIGALALTLTLTSGAHPPTEAAFSPWVDSNGSISLPTDFRARWAHLGSWAVGGTNKALSFHDVYTEPETVSYFREHQEFPDGATLVKEVRSSQSDTLTTGHANWADQEEIWFVIIKDTKGRFEGNPLWGDGWGWALFEAEDRSKTVTKDYSQECRSCHVPAKQTDWVYVYGYPTLEAATASTDPLINRMFSPEEMSSPTETSSRMEMTGPATDEPTDGLVVSIQNLTFTPNVLRVKRGQTVTWANRDNLPHTATADDERFDTGIMAPGERAQITFTEAGTFPYHCTPHPFMKASVVVQE